MSSLGIERTFSVEAPPDRVWGFLTDPAAVVTCLPGAALTASSEDGLRHEGTVTVKLGTMSLSYRGTAEFVDVDEEHRRIRVSAKGREKVGAGAAEMSMVSEVLAADGGSEVTIQAEINVTGKIVTFGRGMIGVVSEQLVSDFATSLCRLVSASETEPGPGADSDDDLHSGSSAPGAAPSAPPRHANALSILLRAIWSRLGRMFEPD